MKRVSILIDDRQLELINELVEENLYHSRNDAFQNATRDLLRLHKKL